MMKYSVAEIWDNLSNKKNNDDNGNIVALNKYDHYIAHNKQMSFDEIKQMNAALKEMKEQRKEGIR